MERICENCGVRYEAERASSRFHSAACRAAFHRGLVEARAIEGLAQALTPTAQGSERPAPPPSPAPPPVKGFEEPDEVLAVMEVTPGAGEEVELIEFEGRLLPRVHECSVSEADYIANEVEITRAQMKIGMIKTNPIVNGKDRLDRTADYARWRYRGFLCGEVASL